LPALFLIIPLIGIIIANIPGRKLSAKLSFLMALIVSLLQIFMAATSGCSFWQGIGTLLNTYLPFSRNLQVNTAASDITGSVVLATIGLIAFVSLIIDRSIKNKQGQNFSNMLMIIMIGMSGIVLVLDIFSMYVFLEITAVASFILISIQREINAFEGAFKYFVMSALATLFLLSGIAIVFLTVGAVDFASISAYLNATPALPLQMIIAFILFIAGLSIKAGAVPFHGWLPDAYSSAPASVSVLLAGIVTKVTGVYTVMRLVMNVFNSNRIISLSFMVIGTASIVVGALAAIGQKDFKRMLAYSSISQVGYIVLAAGLGTPLGYAAALLHFFNHATFKSLLFVNSSAVESATGTREMEKLGGLAYRMPVTAGTSVVGFLSAAGIPPLSGFWSKLLIIMALFKSNEYAFAVIALLASILTLGYFLIMQRKVFFGKLKEEWKDIKEARASNTVPALLLSAITVIVGVLFPIVLMGMQIQ
jgi:proton-translocating NADH-quinone oxidoreductase chain N